MLKLQYEELKSLKRTINLDEKANEVWAPLIQRQQVLILNTFKKFNHSKDNEGNTLKNHLCEEWTNKNLDIKYTNDFLAHELMLDPNFKLELPEPHAYEPYKKEFIEFLSDSLKKKDYSFAPVLIHNIMNSLLHCALGSKEAQNKLKDVLDDDLLLQQISRGSLEVGALMKFVVDTMGSLCAPDRDKMVESLRSLDALEPLIAGIIETLALMKLDVANYQLRSILPFLKAHGYQYELEMFLKRVGGFGNLNKTERWLTSALTRGSKDSLQKTFVMGIADILFTADNWSLNTCPEILKLDYGRLKESIEKIKNIVKTACTLLHMEMHARALRNASVLGFKKKLSNDLLVLLSGIEKEFDKNISACEHALKLMATFLRDLDQPELLHKDKSSLTNLILQSYNQENVLNRHVKRKLRSLIEDILSSVLKTQTALKEWTLPRGNVEFSALENHLNDLLLDINRVVLHDYMVYGDICKQIIASIRTETHEAETD
ncbi:T-complex protein 11-like protein 2 isoform X2 [Zophobas morio]|uniref:T-complex protein 11-like protein 2 isoform X2 n=1 Tax=Zophobas morio TaxID=2755281 RepID=UPI0030827B09